MTNDIRVRDMVGANPLPHCAHRMQIKTRILWALPGTSLLMALVGALAVNRQNVAATVGATKEAENVARVLGFLLPKILPPQAL